MAQQIVEFQDAVSLGSTDITDSQQPGEVAPAFAGGRVSEYVRRAVGKHQPSTRQKSKIGFTCRIFRFS